MNLDIKYAKKGRSQRGRKEEMVRKFTRRMRRNPMTKMMRRFTTKRRMASGMRTRMVRK